MPLRRALYATAPAVALLVAGLALGEWSQRQAERRDAIQIPWDAPALKYEFVPGGNQNSHGYNEREVPVARPAGTLRVAALGDSVTHGAFVPSAQAWPRQLEEQLRADGLDAQVLNFGVYGYDTESVAAQLRHRVAAWTPDLVIYGFYVNDPMPTELVTADGRPVFVGTGPRDFRVVAPPVDAVLHRFSALFRRFEGASASRALAARDRRDLLDWAGFEAALDTLNGTARSLGVPLVTLLIPPHVLVEPDLDACDAAAGLGGSFCEENLAILARAAGLVQARGMETVDGLAAYRAAGPANLHGRGDDPHHPNAEGHRRLAAALAPVVEARLAPAGAGLAPAGAGLAPAGAGR